MAATICSVGPFGPGLRRIPADENSKRYFRSTSALWNRRNVAGLRIAVSFATRRGRTNSVVNPSTNRSNVVRGGRASTGAAADNPLVLEQQRLGDDGADAAGARKLGRGDNQSYRKEKQVTHRRAGYQGSSSAQDSASTPSHAMLDEFAPHSECLSKLIPIGVPMLRRAVH